MVNSQNGFAGDAVHTAVVNHGAQQLVFLLVGGHQIPTGDSRQNGADAPAPPVGNAGGQGEVGGSVGADHVTVVDTLFDHIAEIAHAQLVAAVADADGDGALVIQQQVGVGQQVVDVFAAEIVEMSVGTPAGTLDGDNMGGLMVLQKAVAKGLCALFGHAEHLCRGGVNAAGSQHGSAGGLVGNNGDLFTDLFQNGSQIGGADGAVGFALAAGTLHREAGNDENLTGLQQGKAQFFQIGTRQIGGQATMAGVGLHDLPDAAENVAHIKNTLFLSYSITV